MTLPRRRPKARRRSPQFRCQGHRTWVASHECSVPGCPNKETVCCHVRTGTDGYAGEKPSDFWTLAMCTPCHSLQHQIGEPAFERRMKFDMKAKATEFAMNSPHRRKWMDHPAWLQAIGRAA